MNHKSLLGFLLLVLSAWALPHAPAQAATVLYDAADFIQNQQSYVESFNITTPGTLTVTLSDVPWLDAVSDLTGFVTTPSGVLGTPMGPGTESFKVGPGTVYAQWFGDAQGAFGVGVVGVDITFQPTLAPVPLPGSLLLLLSGLAMLFGWQWRETRVIVQPRSVPFTY